RPTTDWRWSSSALPGADVLDDLIHGQAEVACVVQHRIEVFGEEGPAAAAAQGVVGAVGHEHAQAAPFEQHALLHQIGEGLGGGGRVDAVALCVLRGGHDLLSLPEPPGEDVGTDLVGDLHVDRVAPVEHARLRSLVHYSTNEPWNWPHVNTARPHAGARPPALRS